MPAAPAAPGVPGVPGVPVHLVAGPQGHGVALCARQLAAATGAEVVELAPGTPLDGPDLAGLDLDGPIHLHVTDRIWGETPEEAARAVAALCAARPTTLTFHDVPQPHDGRSLHPRRRTAYAAMAAAAAGVVVCSRHERTLLGRVLEGLPGPVPPVAVVPLPAVSPRPRPSTRPNTRPVTRTGADPRADRWRRPGHRTLGVAGWVYPGKGHLQAIGAAAALARRGLRVDVLALGAVAAGHAADAEELVALGARAGVDVRVSGWLPEAELDAALAAVDVPYAGHRNVSASGSVNSWLAAGRRPLVRRGPYFEEMARLRPGTLTVVDVAGLPDAVAAALAAPTTTWLQPGAELAHGLEDAARAYRRFWGQVHGQVRVA